MVYQYSRSIAGEKCLASPLVYAKTAYYTTFAPTAGKRDRSLLRWRRDSNPLCSEIRYRGSCIESRSTNDVGGIGV